ncbi:MAG: hypothetical protein ACYS0G_16260 [Planctomycetota bacterium]|jgi:hypothetical protein
MRQILRAFTAVLLLAPAALGQGDGDYNGDGNIDEDDLIQLAGCMTGPAGESLPPGCAVFDFDLDGGGPDGTVDLADFQALQQRGKGPKSCTLVANAIHAGAAVAASSGTGASAKIRTRSTVLCGEPIAVNFSASAAWTGVINATGNITTLTWIQTGYARERARNGPSNNPIVRRFAEARVGPNAADYVLAFGPAPTAGTHRYKCYVFHQLFKFVKFEYDDTQWWQWEHDNLAGWTGNQVHWMGEIKHIEDQMVGTPQSKCDFTECQLALNWGAFGNANIVNGMIGGNPPGNLVSSFAWAWGVQWVSPTAINIWDKVP